MIPLPFKPFPKIARLSRDIVITEKLDGTNGVIAIDESSPFLGVGSRNRWITPEDDNFGFAGWAYENKNELLTLGPGYHYGEWWGQGIQRGYGLAEKRFSLFNVGRWNAETPPPAVCHTVPILYRGNMDTSMVENVLADLEINGSAAAPGFMRPEGIIIFHAKSGTLFKKTVEKDEQAKGE